jgi:UDP-N-acetylmuramate dehydrogenase
MIDEMGMKGTRRGGALVSPVHANFIVTEGENASATDTLALAEEIRERIRRERGIELEYEVELWRAAAPEESPQSEEVQGPRSKVQSQEQNSSGS